jgi:hypothetical protein
VLDEVGLAVVLWVTVTSVATTRAVLVVTGAATGADVEPWKLVVTGAATAAIVELWIFEDELGWGTTLDVWSGEFAYNMGVGFPESSKAKPLGGLQVQRPPSWSAYASVNLRLEDKDIRSNIEHRSSTTVHRLHNLWPQP